MQECAETSQDLASRGSVRGPIPRPLPRHQLKDRTFFPSRVRDVPVPPVSSPPFSWATCFPCTYFEYEWSKGSPPTPTDLKADVAADVAASDCHGAGTSIRIGI